MRQPFEHHDRGQAALGEEITLGCVTLNGSGTPTDPDACPTMKILDSAGAAIVSRQIPIQDKSNSIGRFAYNQYLGSDFSTGRYWVTYDWTTGGGGYSGGSLDTFEVVAGGDANGELISLFHFNRPHGNFLIGQTNGGKLLLARNPKV